MYNDYFHFKEPPFSIAPDPHFLYLSNRHQEGLAHLLYGINSGGFIALTGEVGTGKTTLCHCLLQQLPDDVDIALILNPKLNSIELLANICDELDISYPKQQTGLKALTDVLNNYLLNAHAKGRRTVLLIDEAQNLSMDVLEQIRLLTNLETPKSKLLQIILVGQPELKQILGRKDLRQLNQRITARYHLEPLTLAECRIYINHRLNISGGDSTVFKENAIRRIFKLSNGIPRLINILCDRALLGAYSLGTRQVTPAIVSKAANEALDLEKKQFTQMQLVFFILSFMVLILIAINFLGEVNKNPASSVLLPKQNKMETTEPLHNQTIAKTDPGTRNTQNLSNTNPNRKNDISEKASKLNPVNYSKFIENDELSLSNALLESFHTWQFEPPKDQVLSCDYAVKIGFRCLFDRGTLKDLLSLNRPAILEMYVPGQKQKRYVLFTGMKQGYPIINSRDKKLLRLEDLLDNWQGYYLILWDPPLGGGMQGIYPQKNSPNVLWLRKIMHTIDGLGLPEKADSRFFDKQLETRVRAFQQEQNLTPDGIAGTKTLIHLQNATDSETFPKLERIE